MAMSRALGAAFLNHQVEQLEKSVSAKSNGPWRERRYASPQANADSMRGPHHNNDLQAKPRIPSGGSVRIAKRGGEEFPELERKDDIMKKDMSRNEKEKDADMVVVDVSVLVHAIGQVKKWCKDGREEIVIVPLEGAYFTIFHIALLT